MTSPPDRGLPIVGQVRERADAARNRRALLAAAGRILVESGASALSMERVAAEAGVGVGTVYRRFGDRGGLAFALLDHTEQQFQAEYMAGPPPLGPGAPPVERIRSFLHGYVDRLETEADLHAMAELRGPTARHDSGSYRMARAHLVGLLTEAGSKSDLAFLADALLALVDAGLFIHQRRERGMELDEIKAGLDDVLAALVADSP